jgi:molybdopterin synthase catalytic subunit
MELIVQEPINPATAYDLLEGSGCGSIVFHYAVVKADAGSGAGVTTCIDYRDKGSMEEELRGIAADIRGHHGVADVLLVRRTGCLRVGEIISLVAASSPNSEDAFSACRYGIGRMKKMTSVHKSERYL